MMDQLPATPPDSAIQPEAMAVQGKVVLQQALIKLLALARREIVLVLPALSALFDEESISQALVSFVRQSAKREVVILLNSLSDQPANSHQLVRLAQRMPSRFPFKQVQTLLEPPIATSDYLVIVDRQHMLRIDRIESLSGWFDLANQVRAEQYAESVFKQWPKAKEIGEFKRFMM